MDKYNHNRSLSEFQEKIDKLKFNGFYPIAVTQLYLEDTFVFGSTETALKAYHTFERDEQNKFIGKIVGWWYGRKEFIETVKEYETEHSKVLIHWLD